MMLAVLKNIENSIKFLYLTLSKTPFKKFLLVSFPRCSPFGFWRPAPASFPKLLCVAPFVDPAQKTPTKKGFKKGTKKT